MDIVKAAGFLRTVYPTGVGPERYEEVLRLVLALEDFGQGATRAPAPEKHVQQTFPDLIASENALPGDLLAKPPPPKPKPVEKTPPAPGVFCSGERKIAGTLE